MLYVFPAGTGTTMKVQKYWFMVLTILAAAEWLLILSCSPNLAAAEGAAAIIADRHDENCDLRYDRVTFTITYQTTADEYARFIKDIINHLESGSLSNEIRLLRDPSSVAIDNPNRFLLVTLTNNAQETVTLAIDVVNVYVVAYQAGAQSYFFRDAPAGATSRLFAGTNQHTLSYGGSYGDLEGQAGTDRDQIELGTEALIRAVSSLLHATSSRTQARSFIVVIQMTCEAVRFRDISWRVRQSLRSGGESFLPDTYMLSLETSWGQQSTRVQQSVGGAFTSPLRLQVATGTYTTLRHVRDVVASLALMLFVCRDRSSIMSSRGHDDQNRFRHPDPPLLIKSVVENDHTCPNWEPTMRITGRDGLCVDLRDGQYNNGNPIQLWPCNTGEGPISQLWTIRSDGTIRSNGKCLTTFGFAAGSYVMIYDCPTVRDSHRWEIWDNGTIVNPYSALVLGAGRSGMIGTTLTVQTNVYASQQGWVVSNDTSPREVTIVGLRDLCMQENGPAMWLEECVSGKQEQIWSLYGDGSIRPKQNQDRCLTCLSDSSTTLVTIESCITGSSGQRWVFTNEGTILNLNNGMVMDVRKSNPSLGEIIIYPITGNPNQEWLPLPA